MYLKFNSSICFFVLLMCAIIGCEHNLKESEPPNSKSLSFAKISNEVFISCSSCHLNGNTSAGLDLSDYENIVEAASTERPDLLRIKPGDPDSSYLYMKVTGAEGITGSRMPRGGELTAGQLDLLLDWILAGAPLN